jgi:ankyrin repeat protein
MDDIQLAKIIRTSIKSGEIDRVVELIEDDKARLRMHTPFGTWLHVAAAHGRLDIAKFLVSEGSEIEAHGSTANGTPLLAAASNGHIEIVNYLLSLGAKMEVDLPERNPLFAAIDNGHLEIAKALIDAGIDTTVKYEGTSGKTKDALSYARDWGRKDIEALILKRQKK